jgi:hypothetical protein
MAATTMVVAASSITQGGCGCLVVVSSYRFSHGRRKQIRNIARKRSVLGETPGGRCCLSFPMRTLCLRPCISTGRRSSSKYDCHLLFLNCQSKVPFKQSKGSSDSLRTSNVSRMSRKTCLGRLARELAYLSFEI